MASFQSFLHVGGQVYEILYYDLELGQAVDSLGRPASPVYGGILTIELPTPANDTTLYEWMVSPEKRMDGKVELKRLDSRATLKRIKFYNAYCVDMVLRFDGTANASSFKMTIRISPEQVEIGGLMHDNYWPDETPIGYVPDEQAPSTYSLAAYTTAEEDPPKKKKKEGVVSPQPLPAPTETGPTSTQTRINLPKGGGATLDWPTEVEKLPAEKKRRIVQQLLEWGKRFLKPGAVGIGVLILVLFPAHPAGVANEFERKLPEEDENRYRELEAKRSEALARGGKLSPAEEAEWQALEDRKFPVGRDGGGPVSKNERKTRLATKDEAKRIDDIREELDISKKKNIAYVEGEIDGEPVDLIAESGKNSRPGTTPTTPYEDQELETNPTARDIETNKKNPDKRAYDSEVKMLEEILKQTQANPDASGKIKIVSELPVCDSCLAAIEEFKKKRPNIKVEVVETQSPK